MAPLLPGSTYRVSNASLITAASRKLLNQPEHVRIKFTQEWTAGNPLFKWYGDQINHAGRLVHSIQLRKERKHPFYHQYLILCMGDSPARRYFRLERRQLENEDQPLNSSLSNGVEAYDTIKDHNAYEDSLEPYDCLVQIEFESGIHIAIILEICRAIHKHPSAHVYTLQRFNCYFFAQTILLCSARAACLSSSIIEITKKYDGESYKDARSDTGRLVDNPPPYKPNRDILPLAWLRTDHDITFLRHEDQCAYCWKLALLHRGHSTRCEMYSAVNIEGLFWDGAAQVIQQVLRSMDTDSALQNVLWSTDCGRRLKDTCNALTFWVIVNEWELRLGVFEKYLLEPAPHCDPLDSQCTHRKLGAGIEGLNSTNPDQSDIHLASSPWIQRQTSEPPQSGGFPSVRHPPELAGFLSTSYIVARDRLKRLATCDQSNILTDAPGTYYDPAYWPIVVTTRRLEPLKPENKYTFRKPQTQTVQEYQVHKATRELGFKPVEDYIIQLVQDHANRVGQFKVVLKCEPTEVVRDIKAAMDTVWKSVCVMDQSICVWEM